MKFLARILIAVFLCQTLAHPAQAITSTAFYKKNDPVAQAVPAQPAIESIVNCAQASTVGSLKGNVTAVAGTFGPKGAAAGFTASASAARGNADGADQIASNSHVTAGHTANIQSGGDTTLQGAVIAANTVNADVGGKLKIESLQDTSTYKGQQQNIGGSMTIGMGFSGSLSAGQGNANSNFASVAEQSGIRAGDGGFNVNVKDNTTLNGAAITSTQAAIDANKNSFNGNTAEGLSRVTTSDIQNHADFQASSLSLSTSGGGAGQQSGQAASTTTAAISNMAGNKAARTGDKETGIGQIFEADKVMADVNAQTQITQSFGAAASKAVGDYTGNKSKELNAQARNTSDPAERQALQDEAKKWDEGGIYRSTAHAVIGGLTGGASGAAGAGAAALSADAINQATANLSPGVKNAVGAAIAAGMGAVAGGGNVAGVNAALNEDLNNRQLHPDQIKRIQEMSADPQKQAKLAAVLCVMQNCDVNGLSGYDSNGQALYQAGEQLRNTNPEQFKQLSTEVAGSGLLSGQFAYQPGGWDFTKDAVGKDLNDKLIAAKNAYTLATATPKDLGSVAKGAVKGLANNVKDAPQYPLDNNDEKQGAILANTALVVGPGAVAGTEGALNALGKAWEASKVLGAGEIAMSNGGNISTQQITRMGTPAALDTGEMTKLGTIDSLNSNAAGNLRETVSNSYFERNGFKALDGKCGSNCFDGVYIKGDQVIVNEVKPLNADGSIQLNPSAGSLPTQGTIQWVESRARELIKSGDPAKIETGNLILQAKESGNLTTVVSGVNGNGMVIVKVKP